MQTVGKVISNNKVAEKTFILELELMNPFTTKPKPFQFVMIRVPGVEEFPMSIAEYDEGFLSVIYKVKGSGTEALSRVTKGFIGVRGPFGAGFTPPEDVDVLFVAGGSGIAPLPYLSRFLSNGRVKALWGVKTGLEVFDIRSSFGLFNVEVDVASEDCSVGFCGKASDVFKQTYGAGWGALVLASGPKGLLREVCSLVKEAFVNVEAFVKCAVGLCGSCVVKPTSKLLCIDGPVFNCTEVEKHLLADDGGD